MPGCDSTASSRLIGVDLRENRPLSGPESNPTETNKTPTRKWSIKHLCPIVEIKILLPSASDGDFLQ